ncbi:MAG: chorismate lyase [Methylococcales bacterium]|nr:chorismate lyase [Methylococcales bacterium]
MSDNSYLFRRPPHWKNHVLGQQSCLPDDLQSWLDESGSLTRRLRGLYGRQLRVKLLFNCWKPAFIDECRLLDQPPARYQLLREVLLHAGDKPLVLARTILPAQTIRIARRNLSHLGSRPLGEVIFAYPDLERRRRQFSLAEPGNWSGRPETRPAREQAVWGRRTLYAIHKQPLLVAEFFLPGFDV